MKKIAVVTSGWLPMPPVKGGAVENLVEIYLKRNETEPKAEYTVFSIDDPDARREAVSYRYSRFEYITNKGGKHKWFAFYNKILNRLWYQFRLPLPYKGDIFVRSVVKRIKSSGIKYDGIIIENSPVYSVYIGKKLGYPIVQHLHNDIICPDAYAAGKIVKTSREVWTVSGFIKGRVALVPELKKSGCEVRILYNGIDTERFSAFVSLQEKEALRRELKIGEGEKVLLFVGRIDAIKGVKELLLAFKKLSVRESSKLLIVGASFFSVETKTPYIRELETIVAGLKDRILFTGYVDYARVHQYYQLADITVLPSVGDDAFPLTCLEAMAAGCPLIISDSGGMVEAVGKEAAIIVRRDEHFVENLSKQMELLLGDEVLRDKMSKAAIERAKLFTAEVYYQNYKRLLSGCF